MPGSWLPELGQTIVDADGNELPKRAKLQVLADAGVTEPEYEDDEAHDTTIVRLPVGTSSVLKAPVRVATAEALDAYTRVTNTITAVGADPIIVDGVALGVDDRLLLTEGADDVDNGIWRIAQTDSPFILIRADDADEDAEIVPGMRVPVLEGAVNEGLIFELATDADPIVLNTTPLLFVAQSTKNFGALVDALRAKTGAEGEIYHLKGYSRIGDGGEGTFVWHDVVAYDDGGTRFNAGGLHSLGAGWSRMVGGDRVKVEWFGAVGDCGEGTASAASGSPDITMVSGGPSVADIGKLFAIDFAGTLVDGEITTLVGTILNVVGSTVTLDVNAGSTCINKVARWGTNDADSIQLVFNYLQSKLYPALTYSGLEARLQGYRRYLVHRDDGACLEMGANVKLKSDIHAALVAGARSDIIIRCAMTFNEIHGVQFRYGRHAIVMFGPSTVLANPAGVPFGAAIGAPAQSQSVNNIVRCTFYQQSGPSVFQDVSYNWTGDHPGTPVGTGNDPDQWRAIATHINIRDFYFYGAVLWWGQCDGLVLSDGWVITDNETYPVKWDDGRDMAWVVQSDTLSVRDVSAAPISATTAPWFEGCGHFVTKGFRAGGENSRCAFALRKDIENGLVYRTYPLPVDVGSGTCVYSDCDAWSSITQGRNIIECYDEMPSVISIRRPETASPYSSRAQTPFINPDASIYLDSSSISEAEMYAQNQPSTELNFWDLDVPLRFVAADAVGHLPPAFDAGSYDNYQFGKDVTHLVRQYMQQENSPACVEGRFNYWWQAGVSHPFQFDPSWGSNSIFTDFDLNDVVIDGQTFRQATYTGDNNDGVAIYGVNRESLATLWGSGIPAGIYTISVYVRADFSGNILFYHDSSVGHVGVREFAASPEFQRVSWTFYYNGTNDKELAFAVPSVPGEDPGVTPGVGGSVVLAYPMINAGAEVAPYMLPGLALAAGDGDGDDARFGMAYNFGRVCSFSARHTTDTTDAEVAATLTVAPLNQLVTFVAIFNAQMADGTSFSGTRKAVFKRHAGTTEQIGDTVALGDDFFDAGASAFQATIYNDGDDEVFFEVRDAESSVKWDVDVQMSIQVT